MAAIRALTCHDIHDAYNAYLRPLTGARTRKVLSVQLLSQQLHEDPPPHNIASHLMEACPNVHIIEDERKFKASLGCAPAAVPVMSEAFGRYAKAGPSARL